jgi:hypothetical protein
MPDVRKIIGGAIIILVIVGITIVIVAKQRRIISPVPEEGAIKIIYISPTPTGAMSSSTPSTR